MKRTAFKTKQSKLKRTVLRRRRTALKAWTKSKGDESKSSQPFQVSRPKATPKLKAGPRTKEWDRVRAILKVEFEAMGITSCELNYSGCKRDDWLSFAHGLKRRHLQGDQLKTLTILSCTPCHDVIERLPEAEMCAIVESVIENRAALRAA